MKGVEGVKKEAEEEESQNLGEETMGEEVAEGVVKAVVGHTEYTERMDNMVELEEQAAVAAVVGMKNLAGAAGADTDIAILAE